jgi:hypothetical protein
VQLENLLLELFFVESVIVVHVNHYIDFGKQRFVTFNQFITEVFVKHCSFSFSVLELLFRVDSYILAVEIEGFVLEIRFVVFVNIFHDEGSD